MHLGAERLALEMSHSVHTARAVSGLGARTLTVLDYHSEASQCSAICSGLASSHSLDPAALTSGRESEGRIPPVDSVEFRLAPWGTSAPVQVPELVLEIVLAAAAGKLINLPSAPDFYETQISLKRGPVQLDTPASVVAFLTVLD